MLILNVYVPNNRPSKYIKQKLMHKAKYIKTKLKGERDKSKILARDFKNPLSVIHRTSG